MREETFRRILDSPIVEIDQGICSLKLSFSVLNDDTKLSYRKDRKNQSNY